MSHDRRPAPGRSLLALLLCAALAASASAATVYKWVDENGTTHLSSAKPPPGVKYETLAVGSPTSGGKSSSGGGSKSTKTAPAASPQQSAERLEVISSLQNRECVIALEALDRLTSGTQPTTAAEIRRLKQTVDANCSVNPARRRQQEEMAAKLRVANGPECVKARNELAGMTAPGSKATSAQQRAQQAFVDANCIPLVR